PTLGELVLPLKSVVCVVRAGQSPPPTQLVQQTEDIVTLANGDSVRGIISGLNASSVSVQPAGADAPTAVPLDSVARITFATTAVPAPQSAVQGFRIGLVDGSGITAATVQLADQRLSMTLPDGSNRSVPQSALVSIEHVNGPLVWLSSLPPAES